MVRPDSRFSTVARSVAALSVAVTGGCGEGESSPGQGAARPAAHEQIALFTDVTGDLGIAFDIDRSVAGDYFMPDSMGAGCALFDYDADGDLDIYVVNGFRDGDGNLVTTAGANRLFRQGSDGRFSDATAEAGVGHRGYGMGVAAGDYDNDGDVDLYVTNYGPDCLYRNDGDGSFTDVSEAAGVTNDAWSGSAGFFDYDGDGLLDLFVTNYLDYDPEVRGYDAAGRPEYASPSMFPGVPDVLYHNEGDGTFADRSAAAGIGVAPGKGLGVVFADLDGDGRVDVYVANDGEPNFAWINRGGERFTEEAMAMGLSTNKHGQSEAGMGIAIGDGDGDDDLDIFVTHMVLQTNTLYRQEEPGRFVDATSNAGVGPPSVDRTGFGTSFLDADLDGDLDLLTVNGRILRRPPVFEAAGVNAHWRPYAEPNQLLLNDGTGRFEDAAGRCGAACSAEEVGRGLAVGDVDRDGDLDLVVSNGNGTVRVYRGEGQPGGHWLVVRAIDPDLRREALGAVVRVEAAGRRLRGDVRAARSYLSSSDPGVHFGLGETGSVDEITVDWPGAGRETFPGCRADQVVELRKGAGH